MRSSALLILIFIPLWMACNKGLAPPEDQTIDLYFSIPPLGGNPVGMWSPDTSRSVDVVILNPEDIPPFIDSLKVANTMTGFFSFFASGTCSTEAVLTITPTVYLSGLPTPLVLTIQDTLKGHGPFDIADDRILFLPMVSSIFHLDTLGFSQYENVLDLISLPNTFPDPAFSMVLFTFVFHLKRDPVSEPLLWSQPVIPEGLRTREGRP